MTDIVETEMPTSFKAWPTPKIAILIAPGCEESGEPIECGEIAVADLSADAVNTLAEQWLTHLYSGLARKVPFNRKDGSHV